MRNFDRLPVQFYTQFFDSPWSVPGRGPAQALGVKAGDRYHAIRIDIDSTPEDAARLLRALADWLERSAVQVTGDL